MGDGTEETGEGRGRKGKEGEGRGGKGEERGGKGKKGKGRGGRGVVAHDIGVLCNICCQELA